MKLTRQQQKAIFAKLKIKDNIRNTNPKFVKIMKESLLNTPLKLQNKITTVTLLRKKKGQAFGDVKPTRNRYDIRIRFEKGRNLKEFPVIYNHELDHLFFDQILRFEPQKLKQYKSDIREIIPFNSTLKKQFSDAVKMAETGNKKKTKIAVDDFVHEFHSETREADDRIKLGLDPAKFNQPTRKNLNQAIFAYKKLHR